MCIDPSCNEHSQQFEMECDDCEKEGMHGKQKEH